MRRPYQVLVIPYKYDEGDLKFGVLSRADMACWQWIAGGGEDEDETILESAKREAFEEAGISKTSTMVTLATKTSIPVVDCAGGFLWGPEVLLATEHCFAVEVEGDLNLSSEHESYRWVSYQEARSLLKYDSNKTALWELVTRLNDD